jgi:predicted transglutaminase-like cysteine proteinase
VWGNPRECPNNPSQPRRHRIVADRVADLLKVNQWVNENVKPMTDMEHWGVIEK